MRAHTYTRAHLHTRMHIHSCVNEIHVHNIILTLQQTTMIGTPMLQMRVVSPSGKATPSSSVPTGPEDSSGST